MPADGGHRATPTRANDLQFACPRCRAPLDLEHDVDRCGNCGFAVRRIGGIVSFVADSSAEEWRKYWEKKASGPDGNTSTGDAYNFSLQHHYMVDGFRALCGDPPASARILDIGCGNGLFWQALFGNRAVVGVDFSIGMCSLAMARGMEVYHADARALPFADAQFDLLYSAEILQYIDDLPALMAELARICRPGGHIIVSTLNRLSLLRRSVRAVRRVFPRRQAAPPAVVVMRSAEEISAAGQSAHLRLGTICRSHFPLPWRYNSSQARHALDPLASNAIVEFIK